MMSLNLRVCVCVKGPAMNIVAVCWHKSYHDDARYAFFLSLSHLQLSFYFFKLPHTPTFSKVCMLSRNWFNFELMHIFCY